MLNLLRTASCARPARAKTTDPARQRRAEATTAKAARHAAPTCPSHRPTRMEGPLHKRPGFRHHPPTSHQVDPPEPVMRSLPRPISVSRADIAEGGERAGDKSRAKPGYREFGSC